MASELAELYVILRATTSPFTKGMSEAAASGESFASKLKSGPINALAGLGKVVTAGAVGVAVASAKMAGDFQASMLRLKTSAGNTGDFIGGKFTGDLKVASDGILKMAVDTGTSTKELAQGMYVVQSASLKANGATIGAADALKVLKAAAEGAKAEGADVGTVVNALTTYMNDYHLSVDKAVPAMNQLIAAVSSGKTNLQDFAGALHSVLPIASSAHLSFGQVAGAMATMTAHGVTADLAGQHLANMMRNLLVPMKPAQKEMQELGIDATDLKMHLGDLDKGGRGLTGTLDLMMQAITRNVDKKTGLVLAQQLDQSKAAAAAAKSEFQQMPAAVQKLATEFLNGAGNVKGFGKEVGKLPVAQQQLLKAFEANSKKATGFSASLKGNKEAAQTVDEALKKLTGGAVGLEAALQLTGENADSFKQAVTGINDAGKKGGKDIDNWAKIQQTFNQQLSRMRSAVEVAAITLGTKLIPVLMKGMDWVKQHRVQLEEMGKSALGVMKGAAGLAMAIGSVLLPVLKVAGDLFGHGGGAAKGFGDIIGGFLTAALAAYAAKSAMAFGRTVKDIVTLGGNLGKLKGAYDKLKSLEVGGKLASGFETLRLKAMYAGDAFKSAGSKIAELSKSGGSAAMKAVSSGWDTVRLRAMYAGDAIKGIGSKALDAGKAAATAAADVGKLALQYTAMGAKAAWSAIQLVAVKTAQLAIKAATLAWTAVQWLLDAAMAANPLGLVVIAIVAVVAAVVYAWTHFAWFRTGVMAAFHAIGAVVMWWWHNVVEPAYAAVGKVIMWLYNNVVKPYFRLLLTEYHAIADVILWWWHNIVEKAFNAVGAIISFWWNDIVKPAFRLVTDGFSSLASAVSNGVGAVVRFVGGLPGKILSIVANFGTFLVNAGKNLVIGLINGVGSMAGALWDAVVGLAKSALHGILHTFGIASPSKVMHGVGVNLVEGLINGVRGRMPSGGIAAIMAGGGGLGSINLSGGLSGGAGALAPAGGGTVVNHYHYNTHYSLDRNTIVDGQKLYDLVQREALIHNRRNPTNGLSLR